MGSTTPVKHISECFIKPLHNLSPEAKQPFHFTAFELPLLNVRYSQKGLLFAKPSPPEIQDFSISAFLDDLKHSLSATLDHFYPLAARFATQIKENPASYVIYLDPENIQGVKFIYAKADNATISDILSPIDVPSIVRSFFDLNDAINHDGHTIPLLSIQVTELVDGIFIAGSVNHLVADGTSFWHFMSTWSEIFRSKNQYNGSISRPPVFRPSVTPISLPYTHENQFLDRFDPPPFQERFFHFSPISISKLKAKANSECETNKISSLQAVVAVLWRCITRVKRIPQDSETKCSLMISNRRRLNPPLSDDYFGNPVHVVRAITTVKELTVNGLGWAALQLHKAVMDHDDKAIKESIESWVKSPVIYKMGEMFDPNLVHIGSSPRFDMYGVEFGLGKPIAARSGIANKGDGKITMYPGPEGGGSMDVEVCLFPEYMMGLDRDDEFVSAVTS
uniref:uncharacterized acetyltransferase At3g50280-like n=1 Tax=Erigeron canadensis TaxID=72917 RepID=UPI001CB9348C|nr:uncharacterized acetyltransferase At3g50280-like [Erigeron canadensis]